MFVGAATVTEFPLLVVTNWLAPPFMLYVKVYGGDVEAPVNVISGDAAFRQTEVVPETVAVGKRFTVTVALPVCACEQANPLPSCTLTRL